VDVQVEELLLQSVAAQLLVLAPPAQLAHLVVLVLQQQIVVSSVIIAPAFWRLDRVATIHTIVEVWLVKEALRALIKHVALNKLIFNALHAA
jgi:flagellar biosynthesis protein FlhB